LATALQISCQLPILMEIAVKQSRVNVSRSGTGRSEDLAELQTYVAKYLPSDVVHVATRRRLGKQTEFYNSHQWAIKQLKADGYIAGRPNEYYEITQTGLTHLQAKVGRLLRLSSKHGELDGVIGHLDECDRELFINLLERLPSDVVGDLLRNAKTRRQLFLSAFAKLDASEIGSFLCSGYEAIQPLVCKFLVDLQG
jgi:hypothetical protein